MPINLFFIRDEKGKLKVSLNGGRCDLSTILEARDVLIKFLDDLSEEDMERYNEEAERNFPSKYGY